MTVLDHNRKDAEKQELLNEETGWYVVSTASGSDYIFDLDERRVYRKRGDVISDRAYGVLHLSNCAVGKKMVVTITEIIPPSDEIGALFTTEVTEIATAE